MNQASSPTRHVWLDIYRFIFALIIALYHEPTYCNAIFPRGGLAVYFFFLLSGYLAATTLERHRQAESPLGSAAFMGKKLLAVQPEIIVTSLLYPIVFLWHCNSSFLYYPSLALRSFLSDVLLLRMTCIGTGFGNDVTWYISSMMLCLVLLFPFIKKYGSTIYLMVFGLLVIGWVRSTTGTILPHYASFMAGSLAGNYIALGALSLGASLPLITRKLEGLAGRKAKGLACLVLPAIVLYCVHLGTPETTPLLYDILALLVMCIMIAIAAIPDTTPVFPSILCKICTFLGKLSLPFYLVHRSTLLVLEHTNLGTWEYVTVYISLTMVVSALVMAAAGFIRTKISKYYL